MNLTPTLPTSLLLIALVASSPLVAASSAYTDENAFQGDVLIPGDVLYEAWDYTLEVGPGQTVTADVVWEGDAALNVNIYRGEAGSLAEPTGCWDGSVTTTDDSREASDSQDNPWWSPQTYTVSIELRASSHVLTAVSGEIPFTVTISVDGEAPDVSDPVNQLYHHDTVCPF